MKRLPIEGTFISCPYPYVKVRYEKGQNLIHISQLLTDMLQLGAVRGFWQIHVWFGKNFYGKVGFRNSN